MVKEIRDRALANEEKLLEIEKYLNIRIEHCLATMFIRFVLFSLVLVLALAGFVLMPAQSARATTFDVPCNVPALITAINAANLNPGGNTLELAPNCTYTLAGVDNSGYQGNNGLPQITSEMTIKGNGAVIERSLAGGTPDFRFIQVNTIGNLTLNNVAIRNGRVANDKDGGGIANFGVLNVVNSTFANNLGGCGGAIYTKAGGSVPNHLTVANSVFSNNTADG
jgi:hypothetical protein